LEFFAEVKNPGLDVNRLKQCLTISRLPLLSKSIDSVISDEKKKGVIYCLWGEFEINREELRYGVRFTLPHCPNALACTITIDEENESAIVVHCSINKKQQDADFIDSIHQFVSDWAEGLQAA
jgi:hypothetical protein